MHTSEARNVGGDGKRGDALQETINRARVFGDGKKTPDEKNAEDNGHYREEWLSLPVPQRMTGPKILIKEWVRLFSI